MANAPRLRNAHLDYHYDLPPDQTPDDGYPSTTNDTRWLPSSSPPPPPPPPAPISSSLTSALDPPSAAARSYAVSHTPYSSPQRPTVQTLVRGIPRLNGASHDDDSPDPHDFYRHFQDPFVTDDMTTTHSYQRGTAASAARAQQPPSNTSRYLAKSAGQKTYKRSSSVSSEVSASSRMRKPSLKDLVHRFEQQQQAGEDGLLQPSRPSMPRNISSSNNGVTFLRSRTPSNQTVTLRENSAASKANRPLQPRRPSEGSSLSTTTFPQNHDDHRPPHPERSQSAALPEQHLPTTNGASFSSTSSSSTTRIPLFGEILSVDSHLNDAGYGINHQGVGGNTGQRRRGSEGSLYPPSPAVRSMEYSPSSPTAWYLGPPSNNNTTTTQIPRDMSQSRGHRRAHSEFVGDPSITIITPQPTPKRVSQSKIPLSTRIRSPSETGHSPPSSRSNSSLGKTVGDIVSVPRGHSGIPIPKERPTTPTRPKRRENSPAVTADKSPGSLKAYISAPMPKKSPPLRSSRPRQPISSSNTPSSGSRSRMYDYQSSRDASRTRDAQQPTKKKIPELGGVDFAARREQIQRAFTKSVRESEKKEEIQRRRRLARPSEDGQRERAQKEQEEGAAGDQPHQTEASNHDRQTDAGYISMQPSVPTSPTDTASEEIHFQIEEEEGNDQKGAAAPALSLDTLLPSTTYTPAKKGEEEMVHGFQSPDSPTLGMPGGFPQSRTTPEMPIPSINLEPDSATSEEPPPFTPIEDDDDVGGEFRSTPTRSSSNLLSQIMQMRELEDESPSQRSEVDDKETIDIMLGGTPPDGLEASKVDSYPWEDDSESPLDPDLRSNWVEGTPKPTNKVRAQPSADRLDAQKSEQDWSHVALSNDRLGTDTMNSEAYSTINRVLDQYHAPRAVSDEMLGEFQGKILEHSPELARQGGWDPTRMTQLYLQELAKGKVKNRRHLAPVDTLLQQHGDSAFDAITPVTEIDHDEDLIMDRPRGYQLSDGGWSSQRESVVTEDSQVAPAKSIGSSLTKPSDWIDASPSLVNWNSPETPALSGIGSHTREHPPLPPPKDLETSPPRRPGSAIRDDSTTPRLGVGASISTEPSYLPEIKTAGEGLGLRLDLDLSNPPLPTHSPPVPPEPSKAAPVSPSIYSRNPPSSVFPNLFPNGRGKAPTSIRLGEDDSGGSRSPGTPVPTNDTPPTSDNRSQERPSVDIQSRKSTELQREETGPSPEQKRLSQRRFVIKELVDTEKSFLQDMTVLDEIYKGTASPPLNLEDVKTLFGNSDQIVAFSKTFLESLKQAANSVYVLPASSSSKRGSTSTAASVDRMSVVGILTDDEKDRKTFIGEAFGQHMARMEKVYSEYLRNHDAANKRLVKIQNIPNVVIWLKECRACADDLTTAWSLDSLLVKPVQRILKYPLLLNQLLEVTPENHPDFTALDVAVREMTGASHRINEMKKRADVLEKVVGRKRKESDVRTGLSKAFGRRTEKFRQQVGLSDMYEDREYAEIAQKFGSHFMHLHLVMKDVETYTSDIQAGVDKFLKYVAAIDDMLLLAQSGHPELESKWRKFGQAMREMSAVALADHKAAVKRGVIDPMVTLLGMHDGPQKIMAKRNKRLMDYGRLRALRERGDKPDKRTIEQGDQFTTLNDTLKDELPKLFALTTKLVEACLRKFVSIQMAWHTLWRQKLEDCLDAHSIPKSNAEILSAFNAEFPLTRVQVESLGVCNGTLLADAVSLLSASSHTLLNDDNSFSTANTAGGGRSGSASSGSSRPPISGTGFGRHRTASMNSDKSPSLPTPDFGKRHSGTGFGGFMVPASASPEHLPPAARVRSGSGSQQNMLGRPPVLPPTSDPSRTITPATTRPSTGLASRNASYDPSTYASPTIAMPGAFGTSARPPTPLSRPFSNVFTSALPLSDSPPQGQSPVQPQAPHSHYNATTTQPSVTPGASIPAPPAMLASTTTLPFSSTTASSTATSSRRATTTSPPGIDPSQYNVLFLAASLFEFNIDRARKEAGYPYLTYVPGEIFDVIGEKGELWLAKNQDDPSCLVGWIWCKHFAKLEGEGGGLLSGGGY